MTFHKPGQVPEEFLKEVITAVAASILEGGGTGSGRPAGYKWTPKDYEARLKHKLKYAPAPEFKAKLVDTDNPLIPSGKSYVIYDKWENWRDPLEWSQFTGEKVEFTSQEEANQFAKNLSEALAAKEEGKRYVLFTDESGNISIFDALKMQMMFTDDGINAVKQLKWLENDFQQHLKQLASLPENISEEDMKAAMSQYKDGEYRQWNDYLRDGKMGTKESPEYEKKINNFDKAMQYFAVPISKTGLDNENEIPGDTDNVKVFRGISVGGHIKWLANNDFVLDTATHTFKDKTGKTVDPVGHAIIDGGFTSTATAYSFAHSWGGGNVTHITMPKTTRCIKYSSEHERVIARSGAYLIKKLEIKWNAADPQRVDKITMHVTLQKHAGA